MRRLAGLLLAALLCAPAAAEAPRVTGFEHRVEADGLSLRLALSAGTQLSRFTLADPPRLVLDFPALDWPGGPPEADDLPGIEAIRYGRFGPGRMRIVIALDAPMAVETRMADGPVLEIALGPTDPVRFREAAGWPDAARWTPGPLPEPPGEGIVVAIDPGHGGIDPGAERGGLVEKEIVLEIGKLLAARIAEVPGLVPFLTRTDDRFIPLGGRIRLARAAGAHLFLSLHADALQYGEATGVSVYTLSERGADSGTEAFVARENRVDVLAGADLAGTADDVTRVLIDLARRSTQAESARLADGLVAALSEGVDLLDTRPHRRGNFYVLKAPDLPSVLIELGFLTSAEDRARLMDPGWRARVTERIAAGVLDWSARAGPGFLAPRPGRAEVGEGG